MNLTQRLEHIRTHGGAAVTTGLCDNTIAKFEQLDPQLTTAVDLAVEAFAALQQTDPELLALDEHSQISQIQAKYVNFYPVDAVNPYVSLAAKGPWLVTLKGAVLYDCGGYGMLGFGHVPSKILDVMNQEHVMANIMTPNISHMRFAQAMDQEIGHTRGGNPFSAYFCLNSGSEIVSLATRISDINSKARTDAGGPNAGQRIRYLGLTGAFHGRTERPARYSDSTYKTYSQHLASYRDRNELITVEPNNLEQLQAAFDTATRNNEFIEAFFLEPVMGEGNPGMAVTPEFYALARKLTREHGSMFVIDSIQAGLRAQGVLSVVDYPGFQNLDAPDMESYSKALNAAQYPMSVLAVTSEAAAIYKRGVYGNTMTANPRAMDVGAAVLNSLTNEVRLNIRARGEEMVTKLKALQHELGDRIVQIQGTGLLVSAELNPDQYKSYGANSTEEWIRKNGVNVIHGGTNALRYTPYFMTTSEEVDLMVDATRRALLEGPVKAAITESEAA